MPMIQVSKFAISKKQFTVDPSTFCVSHFFPSVSEGDRSFVRVQVDAIWFARKDGVLAAFSGPLYASAYTKGAQSPWNSFEDLMNEQESYETELIAQFSWDGEYLWRAEKTPWDVEVKVPNKLAHTLDGSSAVPAGHVGWYQLGEVAG